jgi:hypothetical protein
VGELCGEDEASSGVDEAISARMSGEHQWRRGGGFIAEVSGGCARVPRIYASPCSEATPRCAAAQSCRRCNYSAREASGDDEAPIVSLTVGHTARFELGAPEGKLIWEM